jgi:nicotinate-nucleotide pyrophosphorylase (carboxylating)
LDSLLIRRLVENALVEDVGSGDITARLTVADDAISRAIIRVHEDGVLAGIDIAEMVFAVVDSSVEFAKDKKDGDFIKSGDALAFVEGNSRSLLLCERVALNFLQRLSGIATRTARFVKLVEGTRASIVDTRKTTPGLRVVEKYAVRVGGGKNHRFGLYDGVLIKDNHIVAAGGIMKAVEAARRNAPHSLKIEVEVTNLDELKQALEAGADAVLLDNMDIETMRRAVEIVNGRAVVEASGGVSEENVAEIASTGVDLISVGSLTHSVKSLDISMDFLR